MHKFLITLLLSCLSFAAMAQKSVEQLNEEIRQAQAEIDRNTKLLSATRANQKTSQRELDLIQSRIASRRRMVRALESQISTKTADLNYTQRKILGLERDLTTLKEEYAQMIRESHRNYLVNNHMAFLFSSRDYDDATRRIDYMRRYNDLREQKAHRIDSLTRLLRGYAVTLDTQRTSLEGTRTVRNGELSTLGQDERQFSAKLATLKEDERTYNQRITNNKKRLEAAQREIARIVAEENRRNAEARKTQSSEQLREAAALTGRFDQNRGKLPYPVRGGVIIDRYGVHAHPTQKGLTVDNKGVNIAGERGAQVRCVFEGVVSRIFFFQGLNNSVMVRHGNYITVYSNLAAVNVKSGDKVSLNQVLGTLANGTNTDEYMLHFEIWNESTNLNPEHWLMP